MWPPVSDTSIYGDITKKQRTSSRREVFLPTRCSGELICPTIWYAKRCYSLLLGPFQVNRRENIEWSKIEKISGGSDRKELFRITSIENESRKANKLRTTSSTSRYISNVQIRPHLFYSSGSSPSHCWTKLKYLHVHLQVPWPPWLVHFPLWRPYHFRREWKKLCVRHQTQRNQVLLLVRLFRYQYNQQWLFQDQFTHGWLHRIQR